MKRPLAHLVGWYVLGLLLAEWIALPSPALVVGGILFATAAWFYSRAFYFFIAGALICLGGVSLRLDKDLHPPNDLRAIVGAEPLFASVRGFLVEAPRVRLVERKKSTSVRTTLRMKVHSIRFNDGMWRNASGILEVSVRGALPEMNRGTELQSAGVITHPPDPGISGQFDYRKFLSRENIHYQLLVDRVPDVTPIQIKAPSWDERFVRWGKKSLARGQNESDPAVQLQWAMALGDKGGLSPDLREPFMESGTLHVFAISGLHVVLISQIILALLRLLRVPRAWACAASIPLLWAYAAATGWQSSAVRATLMLALILAGWALRRPVNTLNSLGAAAMIILLIEPQQLFQASFQLSFAVVLSLAVVMPQFEVWRKQLTGADPYLPEELRPLWKQGLDSASRWMVGCFSASLAAWIGSLWLTAYYFHLVSPAGLIANLAVVPLSAFSLSSNVATLLTVSWFPWAAELFNHCAWLAMTLMIKVSEWAAALPLGHFHVKAPPWWMPLVGIPLLLALATGWAFRRRKNLLLTTSAFCSLGLFFLPLLSSKTELHLLPLSGGHLVWIDSPGKRSDLLIDCGNSDSVQSVVTPFLRSEGIGTVRRLLLTHGDAQHMGGALEMVERFGIREVVASPVRFRSSVYRQVLDQLADQRITLLRIGAHEELDGWRVLHPDPASKGGSADDHCLVLMGSFGKKRVLLLGDLSRAGQEVLMEREKDLQAQIVISGFPSKEEPLCEALLDRMEPEMVLLVESSTAEESAAKSVEERLRRRGIAWMNTRRQGSIRVTFSPKGETVWPFIPHPKSDGKESTPVSEESWRLPPTHAEPQE